LGVSKPFPWKRATISAGNQLKKLVPPTRAKIQSSEGGGQRAKVFGKLKKFGAAFFAVEALTA
jgi:hypothetical protein